MNRKELRRLLDKLKVTTVASDRRALLNKIFSLTIDLR